MTRDRTDRRCARRAAPGGRRSAGFVAPVRSGQPGPLARRTPRRPRCISMDARGAAPPDRSCTRRCPTRTTRRPTSTTHRGAFRSVCWPNRPPASGVDAPARLSLLGTDGFGRDVFSRVLHGGASRLARASWPRCVRCSSGMTRHASLGSSADSSIAASCARRTSSWRCRGSICSSQCGPRCRCTSTRARRS